MHREQINPFVLERRKNIQTLKEYIRDNQPIKYEKIIAIMSIYGLKKSTINDYLEVLQTAGFIEFKDGSYVIAAKNGVIKDGEA